MDKSELVKALADYDSRQEVVNVAIEDEKVRMLLFSLVEERSKDRSLDINVDDMFTESELKRIESELDILHNSMDAISELSKWDSQLVQPVVPSIISFLDYKFQYTNQRASNIISYAVNKDNVELINRAIPKLLNLLDYHEYLVEDNKIDNRSSVFNAQQALIFISYLNPKSLKDAVPVMVKYIDAYIPDSISTILKGISEQNGELIKPIISDIIERIDKKEHILIIGNVAKVDVEIIRPAITKLIKQLDNPEFQEISAYALGIIAQKKVELVQPAIPKLIDLLSSGDKWINISAARSLKSISQQDKTLIDDSTLERLDDIINSVNLFDEIVHSKIENEFAYYDLALSAVNSNPNDPEALKALGEVIFRTYNLYQFDFSTKSKLRSLRSQEKGIEYFLKSAEIRPTYETYQHIGRAYEFLAYESCTMGPIGEKKQPDYRMKCIYYHSKASELNPNDIYSNERISTLNHVLGNYEEAISLMEDLYKKAPNDHDVSCKLASFYVEAAKRLNEEKKYQDAYNFLLKAKNIDDIYSDKRDELDQMLGDENLRAKLRSQINDLKKKNEILTKDTTKKFSEVGDVAYSECTTNSHDLKEDAKTKLDEILAIDTLINKSNQDIVNIKNREQKSGFLSKLGDAISSNTKLGKMKIEIYNLEKNKNSAITDFGATLFKCHKNGEDTLSCLSDLWNDIEDIDSIISKNEDDASNIHKMLDDNKFIMDEKIRKN